MEMEQKLKYLYCSKWRSLPDIYSSEMSSYNIIIDYMNRFFVTTWDIGTTITIYNGKWYPFKKCYAKYILVYAGNNTPTFEKVK